MSRKLLLLCFYCLCAAVTLTSARRFNTNFFNATAHALKVYGRSYYNPLTRVPLEGRIEDTGRIPFSLPKMGFRGLPCACVDMSCGCCAGLNLSTINFDRRYCANFTLNMTMLTIDMKVLMNDDEIFKTSLSAQNPPPVCVPLPYVPVIDFCLRLYDLTLPAESNNNTIQTCLDFETRLVLSPILVMHFNCVRFGNSGVAWVKPGDDDGNGNTTILNLTIGSSTTTTTTVFPTTEQPQEQQATDIFDPVDFENADEIVMGDGIAVVGATTLSPEEEDKIGEHRIP